MNAITLRPVTMADADLLLGWVNAPETLAQKRLTSAPIDRQSHVDWLARRLADPATAMHIIVDGGRPLGQVRLQTEDGVALVDIYVAPEARRDGVAATAISQLLTDLPPGFARTARAEVRADNLASRRLFARLGFTEVDCSDSFVTYEHRLPFKENPR
ncbi:hypothetical protein GCM10007276_10740 [Agaricicola taiwanensis]|uniref:N-acetyltransferase domain-containing protein n=1 Tax=Agaricicola taiwanensis TaxID=591372 RepID=A0A8J2VNM4_9RHOB|nr:GNAT family N-acetyltransferase [Agaricicola taiwanensis]GGE35096.1 hypothetical protein GCM10007276_10740 [Agaricicola taiwanensis]